MLAAQLPDVSNHRPDCLPVGGLDNNQWHWDPSPLPLGRQWVLSLLGGDVDRPQRCGVGGLGEGEGTQSRCEQVRDQDNGMDAPGSTTPEAAGASLIATPR